jgi:hypothetical protein
MGLGKSGINDATTRMTIEEAKWARRYLCQPSFF